MTAKINYAPLAIQDLQDIRDYIASDLSSLSSANKVVEGILDRVDLLEDFPEQGTPLSAICPIKIDYRFVASGNYMVFYRVVAGDVYVDRILYSKSNYLAKLLDGS